MFGIKPSLGHYIGAYLLGPHQLSCLYLRLDGDLDYTGIGFYLLSLLLLKIDQELHVVYLFPVDENDNLQGKDLEHKQQQNNFICRSRNHQT